MEISRFLDAVTDWATRRRDVRGLALVGSHARGTASPASDVDLVMLCTDPPALADRDDWIAQFGEPRHAAPEQYGMVRVLRVFYQDGLEVEFGLNPLGWVDIPLDAGTRRVISDGMRILYDPEGLLRDARDATDAS